ncbi:DUF1835 domain-containing protein [Jeotgalibacillus sp. JSM ZJ347]|uniref:DUF1835 domain-containing protein n=1 Tax=Jeotgalibacillus sp. JSM ZJ347 TaxID=3342117 RepID=UPI0035A8627F
MIDDIKKAIEHLSEEHAKSVLLQSMIRIQMIHEQVGDHQKVIDELVHWQQEVLRMAKNQHTYVERPYQTVHLVCGESPAGSLKVGLDRHQKVIGFPDFFGDGPISYLHQTNGQKQRFEWLKDHMNVEDEYYENEYEKRFAKALKEIVDIPKEVPIVLWSADNADEQTGVRYFLYVMRAKENPVYLINSTSAFRELFPNETLEEFQRHTGGLEPENLQQIYLEKAIKPLTQEERERYELEWESLSGLGGTLRVWKDQQIQAVNENYYDSIIIAACEKATDDQEDGFVKAARIIGEALGRIDDVVNVMFLEYRVRSLVYEGVFEIKGIPKSMRHYSVRVKRANHEVMD